MWSKSDKSQCLLLLPVIGPEAGMWSRLDQLECFPEFSYLEPLESRSREVMDSSESEPTMWRVSWLWRNKDNRRKAEKIGKPLANKLVCFGVTVPCNVEFWTRVVVWILRSEADQRGDCPYGYKESPGDHVKMEKALLLGIQQRFSRNFKQQMASVEHIHKLIY